MYIINVYTEIKAVIEKFVEDINKTTDYNGCEKQILELINTNNYPQHELFKRILLVQDDFSRDVLSRFSLALFNAVPELEGSDNMFKTSARKSAVYLIGDILRKIEEPEFEKFINVVKNNYDYLSVISDINYYLDGYIQEMKRKIAFKEMYSNMGEAILARTIDLLADLYYKKGNLIGLLRLYSEENNDTFKMYIGRIVEERNIFRLLDDIIHTSWSSAKSYYIKKDVVAAVIDEKEIDELLELAQKRRNLTNDEKHIYRIYQDYKSGF